MVNFYTKFLMGVIVSTKGEKEISGLSGPFTTFIPNLFEVFEKAETMGCITEDLACQHISFYLQLGRLDEARKLAEKLCHEIFSYSIRLWLLKASLEIRQITRSSVSSSKADLQSIYRLIKDVLTKAHISKAESLWLMVLTYTFSHCLLTFVYLFWLRSNLFFGDYLYIRQ